MGSCIYFFKRMACFPGQVAVSISSLVYIASSQIIYDRGCISTYRRSVLRQMTELIAERESEFQTAELNRTFQKLMQRNPPSRTSQGFLKYIMWCRQKKIPPKSESMLTVRRESVEVTCVIYSRVL